MYRIPVNQIRQDLLAVTFPYSSIAWYVTFISSGESNELLKESEGLRAELAGMHLPVVVHHLNFKNLTALNLRGLNRVAVVMTQEAYEEMMMACDLQAPVNNSLITASDVLDRKPFDLVYTV